MKGVEKRAFSSFTRRRVVVAEANPEM